VIQSTITWSNLQQRLAEALDVYPTSLHAQYRLSTEPKALPFDLISQRNLDAMIALVRPLLVPALLANGLPSKRQLKNVTVQIFNKGDNVSSEKVFFFVFLS
jgi:hypothetical protein